MADDRQQNMDMNTDADMRAEDMTDAEKRDETTKDTDADIDTMDGM